ncbi:MAG: hypothetical protein M0T86_02690 [Betaproteobacteria bacterium]|nr:hypothetical protein [Betaproteobacteria bacterium]
MSHELHPSIVALVSLAASIASNHPAQGLCQLDRLKQYGVTREHIDSVIEIARHIRDEAAQQLDARLDAMRDDCDTSGAHPFDVVGVPGGGGSCCTPTPSGQSCC